MCNAVHIHTATNSSVYMPLVGYTSADGHTWSFTFVCYIPLKASKSNFPWVIYSDYWMWRVTACRWIHLQNL